MNKKIIIIGGGIAGYTLALELANKDFEIILVEKDKLGGVCLNKGCIPTKSFLYLSKKKRNLHYVREKTKKILDTLRKRMQNQIDKNRIQFITDEAAIDSENSIYLKKECRTLSFDFLVLATGSENMIPEIFRNSKNILTSDSVFNIEKIPEKIIIVGGGYIGIEFATIFNNLGSKVTIIEKENSILSSIDQDVSFYLENSLKEKGIEIIKGKQIKKVSEISICIDNKEVQYEQILICTGRTQRVIDSKIQFEMNNDFIKTNNLFETSQKNIFCIGDSAGQPMLAHKAEYDAKILAKNLYGEIKEVPDYEKIPSCVFSEPQVFSIGSNKKVVKIIKVPFGAIGKSFCEESEEGFIKLGIDAEKRAVYATGINKNAVEVLSALTPIISQKMNCKEIGNIVFAHPTLAEIIKEAVRQIS